MICAATLLACTASSGPESTGEDDFHSKPHGNDVSAGSLVVKAPAGSEPGAVTLQVAPGGQKKFGETFESIPIGEARFTTRATGANMWGGGGTSVPITSATLTEVSFGALSVKRTGGPDTIGLSQNDIAGEMSRTPDGKSTGSFTVGAAHDGSTIIPLPAGDYAMKYGYGDGIVVSVAENAVKKIDIWDYSQRAVARIVPPASRDLPEACPANVGTGYTVSNNFGEATISNAKPVEVGQNPKIIDLMGYHDGRSFPLTMVMPCVTGRIPLPLGAIGAGPKEFKVGRLDVDDVEVTMSDGTKKSVRGTYQVFAADGVTEVLRIRPPTNTGIDLPPGTYKLKVSYPTSAGTQGSYEETFTTP